jgi:hypothetical protein
LLLATICPRSKACWLPIKKILPLPEVEFALFDAFDMIDSWQMVRKKTRKSNRQKSDGDGDGPQGFLRYLMWLIANNVIGLP